jgi:LruC domain-containing protein
MLQKPDGSKQNNSQYIRDNVHVNSTTIKDVHLDLVFLAATGLYHNAMAYYYYPSDKTLSASEIKALPKYVVFPRTTSGIPANQVKVRLQFFGAGYDQAGTDVFPKGYTIGWMLIPGVYDIGNTNYGDNINQVNSKIIKAYKNNGGIYSNHEANTDALNGCITLYDATSQKVVIGFEDTTYKGNTEKGNDQSFDDILFYVDADPISAIYDPDQPTIPDEKAETPDVTDDTRYGTLAYEDIWPKGGDYDLNDVVIEYQTSVTFNGDNVKKIVDTYKVVSKAGAATKADAFGFVINDNYGGTVTSDAPEFTKEESNQFILFSDARKEIGKTFTVTRTFYEGSYPSYASYQRDYNPFIVSAYTAGMKDRTEIHLPKSAATSWASAETGGENAFYVDKTGVYPFSIDIYQVVGLEQVTEMKMIGSEGEYPLFKGWAQSKGVENTDWYLYKNGK